MTVKELLDVTYDSCEMIVETGIEENDTYRIGVVYKGPAYGLTTKTELLDRKIVIVHPRDYSVVRVLIK